MNRHQSNPFLAGWNDDDSTESQRTNALGKKSNPFGAQRSASIDKGKLYQRNMSSFEAASLQLEQHEQLRKSLDTSTAEDQTGLIAKMTAEFESAINTGNIDEIGGVVDLSSFDPFETIVDDDVSIASPAPVNIIASNTDSIVVEDQPIGEERKSSRTKSSDTSSVLTKVERVNSSKHDSIDDDDEEFVSTPVRNIKSSSPDNMREKDDKNLNFEFSSAKGAARSDVAQNLSKVEEGKTIAGQNSLAKASIFASLMASAEGNQNYGDINPDENQATNPPNIGMVPENQNSKSPDAAHVLSDVDRSVAFFDPFETVVDRDVLFSYNNQEESGEERDNAALKKSKASEFDNYVNENSDLPSLFLDYYNDEANSMEDSGSHAPQPTPIHQPKTDSTENNNLNGDTGSQINPETVTESTKLENQEQYKPIPRPVLSTKQTDSVNPSPLIKSPRFAKKNTKEKRKVLADEDSDDSSEDDRIQIVIKTHESSDQTQVFTSSSNIVPLLPPPPSKISIRQARERGKLDDIPSPIRSYRKKAVSDSDSEEDEKIKGNSDNAEKMEEKSLEDHQTSNENKEKITLQNQEDGDDEQDGDQDEAFVIRMTDTDKNELDNIEKPDSPLYDDDTSYALEDFPQKTTNQGWHMLLRYPPKKNWASTRFWKNIFVKLSEVPVDPKNQTKQEQGTCITLQIFDKPDDKKPIQDIPIQPTYTVSDISSQQFDQFGKIFTIKIQYIFYKERIGVRQGQLARFIHTGHIGSSTTSGGHGADPVSIGSLKHYGAPIEHSPQVSQIIKLGCHNYDDVRQFKNCLEDYLFRMSIQGEKVLVPYKTEEVQMAVRDETYIEVNQVGVITKQLARVRLFFLSFLNDNPTVEVGINDIRRQGKEIVGRFDILPVMTEEWIRIENSDLHTVVDKAEFENSRLVKLIPPDATFFELMRFRVRPPRNRELPLQVSCNMSVTRTKVFINVDVMVPGCTSRKHGQIPCESIAIRVFIPECWIYLFREEKHFRMGSVKSVNRRAGKVKGIERFLGGGGNQDINDESSLIEVTSGQAKYEHYHHSIVWRATRWPKENQGSYIQNSMKIRLPLAAHDKMPDNFNEYIHVEYSMPSTTVSHTTVRSISVNPYDDEKPPEKYVKYSAKFEYKVKIRLAVNLAQKLGELDSNLQEDSPIVFMKQQPSDQLTREEDSNDSESDEDDLK